MHTSEIVVPFCGEGSGTGPLTWGQKEIWQTIERTGRTLNIGGAMRLPEGAKVDEIVAALQFLVSRHQALRTRLRFVLGAEYPLQTVSSSGEVVLQVTETDGDPAEAAEQVRSAFEMRPFDYENEWPVRMGVISSAGSLTHLVVQYCHVAVDGFGIDALVRDLANLSEAEDCPPVDGIVALELAAWQSSPAGTRQSGKSLRYWENALQRVPAKRSLGLGNEQQQRFWELFCYSPALHLALVSIAARTGADTTHVLLAAYAVAMARVTGNELSVAQVVVSNRFRPRFRHAVTQLSQPAICVIDTDGTFDEIVARAWKAATNGSLHGYGDPSDRRDLLTKLSAERGEEFDISCFVNDRRVAGPAATLPTDIELALKRTVMRWDRKQPTFDGRFYLQVDSAPDMNVPGRLNEAEQGLPAVYFAIWADTRFLAPARIEACARELEAVAVAAAFDGSATTVQSGVKPR